MCPSLAGPSYSPQADVVREEEIGTGTCERGDAFPCAFGCQDSVQREESSDPRLGGEKRVWGPGIMCVLSQ